jgi:hypothetical protein
MRIVKNQKPKIPEQFGEVPYIPNYKKKVQFKIFNMDQSIPMFEIICQNCPYR